MTMFTQVAATLAGYAFAAAEANQENSSKQAAAQNPMSAAQFFLLFSGIALGTLALIACSHDSKRLAEERRHDEKHRQLVNRVTLFGTEGTTRPHASTFAHSERDEYDAAAARYKNNHSSASRSFR